LPVASCQLPVASCQLPVAYAEKNSIPFASVSKGGNEEENDDEVDEDVDCDDDKKMNEESFVIDECKISVPIRCQNGIRLGKTCD
jgi:hypothetical protein